MTVDREGDFGELGTVFYSGSASANILSFASQKDAGATSKYDNERDYFTLKPKGSERSTDSGGSRLKESRDAFTRATGERSKTRLP